MENSFAAKHPELVCEWSERNFPFIFSYRIANNIKSLLTKSRYRDIMKQKEMERCLYCRGSTELS